MLSLADVLAAIILVALTAYVLFGGADFGGGVWDLLASGPRRTQQRDLVAHAIGPVWKRITSGSSSRLYCCSPVSPRRSRQSQSACTSLSR